MFKTAEDGHVYNDDKKSSGTHHGSVRPETGIKSKGMKGNREHKIETSRNFISHFGDARELGIGKFDGVVGTYVGGSGKNYKIIAYGEGHTFSKDSIKHVVPNMKQYRVVVYDQDGNNGEVDYGSIYAIDDDLAKNYAKHHLLAEGTKFGLMEITPKFREIEVDERLGDETHFGKPRKDQITATAYFEKDGKLEKYNLIGYDYDEIVKKIMKESEERRDRPLVRMMKNGKEIKKGYF